MQVLLNTVILSLNITVLYNHAISYTFRIIVSCHNCQITLVLLNTILPTISHSLCALNNKTGYVYLY
jgi:hypothetical protein